MDGNEQGSTSRYAPSWIFGITNIPYGVAGTYSGVAMPFILHKAGLPLETIALLVSLALLPAAYQLFWAPILDLGIRRRAWLVVCASLGSLCLASSMMLKLPQQLVPFEILMVLGQALVGLVASCNGALVSTTVDPLKRGRAAGWVNAGNLGASVLGGGVVLTLFNNVSVQAAAIALILMITIPSLVALAIAEAPPLQEPLLEHVGNMRKEVWKAVRARRGWTGLLFCISPVGTVALGNLFSGLNNDFHVSNQIVEWVNGYGGGIVTAAGALGSGFLLDRFDRRKAYLASGILTALCCAVMALCPKCPTTYIVGVLTYLLISGLAFAAFSAVVYEIVGTAGSTASTLYSVFPAVGNQAIAYTVFLDGQAHKFWGVSGVFWMDASLNMFGVIILLVLLRVVFRERAIEANMVSEVPQIKERSEVGV
jgi:MFS family permease